MKRSGIAQSKTQRGEAGRGGPRGGAGDAGKRTAGGGGAAVRHVRTGRGGMGWGGRRVAGYRCRLGECPTSVRRKQSVMIKSSRRGSLGPSELVSRETYDSSSPRWRPRIGEERGERGEECGARGERSGERGEGRGVGSGEWGVGRGVGNGERGMESDEGGTARGRVANCSSLAALRLASLAQAPWVSLSPGPLATHPPCVSRETRTQPRRLTLDLCDSERSGTSGVVLQ